jgi:HPt (histidine-containing phosphotransfer) domain-containing protein
MIDWSRITELRNEIGEEDFADVIKLFLEEADEVTERLKVDQDRSELESDLHFLKGSSLNLGFASLSSLCQAGENAAASGAMDDINIGEVLASYTQSRAALIESAPEILGL